jgi:hypothetical protein
MELWKKNLYSLWVAQFTAAVGLSMVMPFLPFYLKELGVTDPDSVKIWSGLVFRPLHVFRLMQPPGEFWATGTAGNPWWSAP